MERQEPLPPIFKPERIDEQIAYLTGLRHAREREETPGAPTVAALRRIIAENEEILERVRQKIARQEESWRAVENEEVLIDFARLRQRKDRIMLQTDANPQLHTLEAQPRPAPRRRRKLFALVAALLAVLMIGGFGIILGLTRAGNPATGSSLRPASISPTAQSTLPVPSSQAIYTHGHAAQVIDSVGISNSQSNGQIMMFVNKFTVGQTIWLVCGAKTVDEKAPGSITIKWYTNDHLYRADTSKTPIQPKQSATAIFNIVYGQPTQGKAEVYWNNELAATVLFVVEPAA